MPAGQIPGEVAVKDASHWNGPLKGEEFPGDGLNFKSSQGICFLDDYFEYNTNQCIANSRPSGAFHFLDGSSSGANEAKWFHSCVKNTVGLSAVKLGFWIDIECRSTGFDPYKYSCYARNCLEEAEQLFGTWVGIYTAPGFWDSYIERNDWAHKHYLWNAQWVYHPEYNQVPPSYAFPWIPYDWIKYDAQHKCIKWQYEGDGNMKARENGFPGKPFTESLDFGRWMWEGRMGTLEEFQTFFQLDGCQPPIPPVIPPVTPVPEQVKIIAGGNLRLRDAPNTTTSSTKGWCKDGTIWYPEGLTVDEVGRYWYWINEEKLFFAEWLTEPVD